MLLKPMIGDGGLPRLIQSGDTVAGAEIVPATVATTNITVTGLQLLQGIIIRSEAANATDTIDTAANVVAAIAQGLGTVGIQPGTTFRVRWVNNAAFTITVAATANTGVTVNRPSIAATSSRDYLITIVNGTPAVTVLGTSTNASAVVSGVLPAVIATLSPGMIVTNAVSGLQGTTILSVNQTAGTITLSANANASASVSLNFSPVIVVDGL